MTRRVWTIVTAVTLTLVAIGGAAAFAAGGGAEDEQDTSPSLGVPAPGYDGVDETVVVDGSGLDIETLPKYDGPVDGPPPITEGPIEEGESSSGGADVNGDLSDNEGGAIVGDGPISNPMPVPGFEGAVDETVVVSSEPDSLDTEDDTP